MLYRCTLLYLKQLNKYTMKIKTPNVLTVRMSDSMKDKVFEQADKHDATAAEVVRTAIKFYLNNL